MHWGRKMQMWSQNWPDPPLPPASRRMRLLAAVGTIVSGVLSYAALKLLLPGWSGARHLAWFVPALLVYWWLARVFVAHQYGVDINPPSEPVKPVEPSTVLWRHPVLVARLVLK